MAVYCKSVQYRSHTALSCSLMLVAASLYYCTLFNNFLVLSTISYTHYGFYSLLSSTLQNSTDAIVFLFMSVNLSSPLLIVLAWSFMVCDLIFCITMND